MISPGLLVILLLVVSHSVITFGYYCPEGWIPFGRGGGRCVFIGSDQVFSLESSREHCENVLGARLASIKDVEDIKEDIAGHLNKATYIESHLNKTGCGVLHANGELVAIGNCTDSRGFICIKLSAQCPQYMFENVQGQCYLFEASPKTHELSTQYCSNIEHGSLLPIIRNSIQNGLIAEKIGTGSRWIGLRFHKSKNIFQWSDGSTLEKEDYTNWWNGVGPGPEDLNTDKCVIIQGGGLWHAEPCDKMHSLICQLIPVGSSSENCASKTQVDWIENPADGMCYAVMNSPKTRDKADEACKYLSVDKNIGNLVSIHTPKQQSFLEKVIPKYGFSGTYWTSMGRNEYGGFSWLDGSPYGYMNWDKDEPSPALDRECSVLPLRGNDGKWRTEICGENLPYICQAKGLAYVDPPSPPTINDCPIGWIRGGSQCFLVSSTISLSYSDANDFCGSKFKGSSLALLRSEEGINSLEGYIKESSYFIGLKYYEESDQYIWIDGNRAEDSLPWSENEPNNPDKTKNCVLINSQNKWMAASCNEGKRFLCSMEYTVCPPHWHFFNNRCFYLSKDLRSCEEGTSMCKDESAGAAHLSSIHSVHENDFIQRLNEVTVHNIWIGLEKKEGGEGFNAWMDGSSLDYTNFLDREDGGKECVKMNTNGYWVPEKADSKNLVSCSLGITHYMNCPPGWLKSKESCYYLLSHKSSFNEAEEKCKELHGYLAVIRREEENYFIVAKFANEAPSAWIGASAESNYFTWNDGSPFSFSKWNEKFPLATGKGSCVKINGSVGGKWENVDCGSEEYSICERPLEILDVPPEQDVGCKEGQIGFESYCYEIFQKKENYEYVQITCRHGGGHIISIENERIQQRIIPFIFQSTSSFYISLKYYAGGWIWDYDNAPLEGFAFWAPDQPNLEIGDPEGLCVEMASEEAFLGQWRTVGCSRRNEALCQYERKGYTSPTPAPKPTLDPTFKCPPGYRMIQRQCYKYIDDYPRNFNDARTACREYGGDLPSFHNLDEEMEIHRAFADWGFPDTYIGLVEHASLSGFRWVNPSISFGTYSNWYSDEPDCPNYDLNCVFIQNDGWACGSCLSEINYICQVSPSDKPFTQKPVPPTSSSVVHCDPGKEDGWLMIPQHSTGLCYKFSGLEDELTWYEARLACMKEGGDLASVHHSFENEYLWFHFVETGYSDAWIGLSSLNAEGKFKWSDGSIFDYDNWKEGEPSDSMGMESCALLYMFEDGLWNDAHCDEKKGYICKKLKYLPSTTPTHPTQPPKGHCPKGQGEFEGNCYATTTQLSLSWSNAHQKCLKDGSELLSIHSMRENAFVISRFLTAGESIWIGAKDIHEENTFCWSDESPFDFTYWGQNQPQGIGSPDENKKNCVQMEGSNHHTMGSWANEYCADAKPFICKSRVDPEIHSPSELLPECPDKSDYVSHLNKCYKYFQDKKSWQEARTICKQEGSTLVSIHEVRANALITSLSETNSWIGLSHDDAQTNHYLTWDDASLYDYSYFENDQVILPGEKDCVLLNSTSGKWSVQGCQDQNTFFCQFKESSGSSVDPSAVTTCPPFPGWKSGPGNHCYMIQRRSKAISHKNAKLSCLDFNGSLAGIHSEIENNWLLKHVVEGREDTEDGYWIGVFRVIDDTGAIDPDVFHWSDGEPYLGGYTNWAEDGLEEDGLFGEFLPSSGEWKLVSDMNHRSNFICSAKKVFPTQPPVLPTKFPPTTQDPPSETTSSTGIIIGSIIASIIILLALIALVYFLENKKITRIFSRIRQPTYSVRNSAIFSNM